EHGEHLAHHVFNDRQVPALRIGIVAVNVAAIDKPPLVGLVYVAMAHAESDDGVEKRLDGFGDEGLEDVALDRQPVDSGQPHYVAGRAGNCDCDLASADVTACRGDAHDTVAFSQE